MPLPEAEVLTNEGLKYLTVKQALADADLAIRTVRTQFELTEANPTACMGLGYGGELATWMRRLYPSACQITLASSAPVRGRGGSRPASRLLPYDCTVRCMPMPGTTAAHPSLPAGQASAEHISLPLDQIRKRRGALGGLQPSTCGHSEMRVCRAWQGVRMRLAPHA